MGPASSSTKLFFLLLLLMGEGVAVAVVMDPLSDALKPVKLEEEEALFFAIPLLTSSFPSGISLSV